MQQFTNAAFQAIELVEHLLAQTRAVQKKKNFTGVTHPGNWPTSAMFAVEFIVHDSQFPNVEHELEVAYFDDSNALVRWLHEKREWIKGTDYDFSMKYKVFEWDLGPNLKYSKSM